MWGCIEHRTLAEDLEDPVLIVQWDIQRRPKDREIEAEADALQSWEAAVRLAVAANASGSSLSRLRLSFDELSCARQGGYCLTMEKMGWFVARLVRKRLLAPD